MSVGLKELFLQEINNNIYQAYPGLKRSVDHSRFASEGQRVIHIPNSTELASAITVDENSMDTSVLANPTDLTYTIAMIGTKPQKVSKFDQVFQAPDLRASAVINHRGQLMELASKTVLHSWAAQNGTSGAANILLTTGSTGAVTAGGVSTAKKLTFADFLKARAYFSKIGVNVSSGNLVAHIPTDMLQDCYSDDVLKGYFQFRGDQIGDGIVARIAGFDVYETGHTVIYDANKQKKAVATIAGAVSTDLWGAVFAHEYYIARALSSLDLHVNDGDGNGLPNLYGGTEYNTTMKVGGRVLRDTKSPVLTMIQG